MNAADLKKLPTWRELVGSDVLVEYDLQFYVNINKGRKTLKEPPTFEINTMFIIEIFDFILEGQQLEHLGCELPVVVRTVIMRKNLLLEDMESVSKVINEYNGIISKLNASEVSLL